jgi:glycosyltransferase involved in cell wall biosynthesis
MLTERNDSACLDLPINMYFNATAQRRQDANFSTMSRVVVVSGDILPYPGLPTTGAGLRAWGLGQGLIARGHEVILTMPRAAAAPFQPLPPELDALLYTPDALEPFLRAHRPDVVVLQHWRLARLLKARLDAPLVIDLHGPLILEVQFQEHPDLDALKREKLHALHTADFFTCAGEKQRHYFQAWLLLAGFDLREDLIKAVPVALSPELPDHLGQGEPTFVYGGTFLPWQNPILGLNTLVECLDAKQTGQLKFFGGKHPVVAMPTARFDALRQQLQRSPRVQFQPMIPRDELIREYCRAHVALDLMQRNAERELAFTTRTVEYLWCGLPVIYTPYAELSGYIGEYNAGWLVDPADQAAIRRVINEILDHPEQLAERSRNAQQLVRDRLTWDRAVAPLDAFCRNPVRPTKGQPLSTAANHSLLARAGQTGRKLQFHLKHEGLAHVLKRGWQKLRS